MPCGTPDRTGAGDERVPYQTAQLKHSFVTVDGTFTYTFLLVGGDALLVDFSEFVMNTVNMR